MHVTDIQLHQAHTLHQACGFLKRFAPDARLLAGGTDLLVDLKAGKLSIGHVVSINRIPDLRGVSHHQNGLRIGALTTPNELADAPLVRDRFPAILDATRELAAPQIRNLATVGGNIASAVPSADLPPILMAMNASVVLWSARGERTVPLEAFFLGPRQTQCDQDELLTAILVPDPPQRFGAAYARFALRAANACAVAGVAASLELSQHKTIQQARIALAAVAPVPRLATAAAQSLINRTLDHSAIDRAANLAAQDADPISDIRASAEYRKELVAVLTRRALYKAAQRAGEVLE